MKSPLRTLLPLWLTLLAVSAWAQGDHSELGPNPEFSELSVRWRRLVDAGVVPGLAVCVVEGDEVLHLETLGVRDPEDELEVTPDTIYYIASATKPFVALACLLLAETGELDLDLPVREYLPRFTLADEQVALEITVRDLLCHRPGLNSFPIVFLDAYTGEITEDRFYHFLAQVQPTWRVTYSNLHFTLAGRVVEAVTGSHWKDALRELILEPAGMHRTTGYADWMYAQEDVAFPATLTEAGYRRASVRKNDAVMHAAGGLGTSILDLSRWLQLHLNDGVVARRRLVSSKGLTELMTEQSDATGGDVGEGVSGFGLGWMRSEVMGNLQLRHGGGYIGSSAHVSFLPELGIGVAVLANADRFGQAVCDLVSDDVYRFLLAEPGGGDPLELLLERAARARRQASSTPPEVADSPTEASGLTLPVESYAGEYTNAHWGTVQITPVGGELVGRMANAGFTLHISGADRFRAESPSPIGGDCAFQLEGGRVVGVSMHLGNRDVDFSR